MAGGQLSYRFPLAALGGGEGVGVVEMGTEGVGQQVEELLRLSRRQGELGMDLRGESAQHAFAGGRLHGFVLVLGCLGGWSEVDDEGGPGGSGRCRLMRT